MDNRNALKTHRLDHRFSVAPMMEWTDRHCRAFHRALTNRALLYTEMVTTKAIIHGKRMRLLGFSPVEHPLVLQVGGSDPEEMLTSAMIAKQWGYDGINLNCGCPSDRVQSGTFGACLMRDPQLVAELMAPLVSVFGQEATVKCRIGVDDQDEHEALFGLVEACQKVGVTTFVVHARKAWLKGLSPKENRDIPPLNRPLVRALKQAYPQLSIILNGGIENLESAGEQISGLDGVMLGRAAYHYPALLGQVDRLFFDPQAPIIDAFTAIERYRPYMAAQLEAGEPLSAMTRHMLGLMHGLAGARSFRRILTVDSVKKGADLRVLDEACDAVRQGLALKASLV